MKTAINSLAIPPRCGDSKPTEGPTEDVIPITIRKLFSVLHGHYGSRFTSGFLLNQTGAGGVDKGLINAQKVWASALARFDAETIAAGTKCALSQPACLDWPPSLNRIEAECAAIQGPERLPPPVHEKMIGVSDVALRQMSVAALEKALAELAIRRKAATAMDEPEENPQLPDLFALVARAVALAGGDEVRALAYAGAAGAQRREAA